MYMRDVHAGMFGAYTYVYVHRIQNGLGLGVERVGQLGMWPTRQGCWLWEMKRDRTDCLVMACFFRSDYHAQSLKGLTN